jgi:hypothetical protein
MHLVCVGKAILKGLRKQTKLAQLCRVSRTTETNDDDHSTVPEVTLS